MSVLALLCYLNGVRPRGFDGQLRPEEAPPGSDDQRTAALRPCLELDPAQPPRARRAAGWLLYVQLQLNCGERKESKEGDPAIPTRRGWLRARCVTMIDARCTNKHEQAGCRAPS
jgi:hypothetical protein